MPNKKIRMGKDEWTLDDERPIYQRRGVHNRNISDSYQSSRGNSLFVERTMKENPDADDEDGERE